MDVMLNLPTAIEGKWVLKDGDGKIIASQSSNPGSVLEVTPHFYRGQQSQTVSRIEVRGKRGRSSRTALKVGATTGKVKAESMNKIPKPIEPAFDKDPPKVTK